MRALRRSLLIRLQELSGLVAEWGDFLVCDDAVEVKAEHAADVMTSCDIVIAVSYVFVILACLLVQGDVAFVPRAFYGEAVFFAIGFIEFCQGDRLIGLILFQFQMFDDFIEFLVQIIECLSFSYDVVEKGRGCLGIFFAHKVSDTL